MSNSILSSENGAPALGSAVKAGLIAGAVFMALEMILVWLAMGMNAFAPPHMIAAIVMGPDVLPGPDVVPGSSAGVIAVGMLVHFVLSVALAFIFKMIAEALKLNGAMLLAGGLVFGLLIYAINFYGMTAIFPWFAMARNWVSILAHAAFGLVLAYALMPRASVTIVEDRGMRS